VKCSLHFHYILSATHPEAQKPPNHKAIPILIKNTQYSDRSLQKPTHSEAQKLPNDKAIATLAKTTGAIASLQNPTYPKA
jgi:hypothetical protein